ncbi:hypothetical protein [Paenibacillus brasilensis]|uniref:Uncharacterized protein n=1 Tax=Paenibacillus brasilensis TaxID=128574 RepID=A0ABU0KW45_9BACL|nr:hypothetical protein [Paenibacillus brasilensis]MDQ0493667.1 hypothetical protein [Paenibacillus brasilensis]
MVCKKVMVWFLTALLATNTLLCLPGVAGAEKQDARNGMQLDQADTKQEEQGLSDGTLVHRILIVLLTLLWRMTKRWLLQAQLQTRLASVFRMENTV